MQKGPYAELKDVPALMMRAVAVSRNTTASDWLLTCRPSTPQNKSMLASPVPAAIGAVFIRQKLGWRLFLQQKTMTPKPPGNKQLITRLPPAIEKPLRAEAKSRKCSQQTIVLESLGLRYAITVEPPKRGGDNRKKIKKGK